jgi:hypothetical protein
MAERAAHDKPAFVEEGKQVDIKADGKLGCTFRGLCADVNLGSWNNYFHFENGKVTRRLHTCTQMEG